MIMIMILILIVVMIINDPLRIVLKVMVGDGINKQDVAKVK